MPLIAVTRLQLRSWRFLPVFLLQTLRARNQAGRAEGNLAVAVLNDTRLAFWTSTAWDSEDAMRKYLSAEPHRGTMRSLAKWCDEASVVHWLQDAPGLPSWALAHQRMQQDGRPSRVEHPSEAQRSFVIRAPRS
jgi:hypothetical protein